MKKNTKFCNFYDFTIYVLIKICLNLIKPPLGYQIKKKMSQNELNS